MNHSFRQCRLSKFQLIRQKCNRNHQRNKINQGQLKEALETKKECLYLSFMILRYALIDLPMLRNSCRLCKGRISLNSFFRRYSVNKDKRVLCRNERVIFVLFSFVQIVLHLLQAIVLPLMLLHSIVVKIFDYYGYCTDNLKKMICS